MFGTKFQESATYNVLDPELNVYWEFKMVATEYNRVLSVNL